MSEPADLSIAEASERLQRRELSSTELVRACLDRISGAGARLNAFSSVHAESALVEAEVSDRRAARGARVGPLDGVPVAIKDNIDVRDHVATNGLARHEGVAPATADATAVARLRAAGAVILGQTIMSEGALGGDTDNPHHGRAHNPLRYGRTPGGSSGGSAAAVAGGLAMGALGTDTMGSVRLPAAYCGIVGLKPTYGLVSTRGVAPMSWRLDHVGPICRTVDDAALMLQALAGHDPDSIESARPPEGFTLRMAKDDVPAGQRRVGVLKNFANVPLQPEVAANYERMTAMLAALGFEQQEIELPGYEPTPARLAGLLVAESESAVFHEAAMAARPETFSPFYRKMIEFGRNAPGLKLMKAERLILAVGHAVRRAFDTVDWIVSPAAPDTAFPFERGSALHQADMLAPANFAGCPAISIPSGTDDEGLPIGLQILAAPWRDAELLALARMIERRLLAGLSS